MASLYRALANYNTNTLAKSDVQVWCLGSFQTIPIDLAS